MPRVVGGVDPQLWKPKFSLLPLQELVTLHDNHEGIALVELFGGIASGLVRII